MPYFPSPSPDYDHDADIHQAICQWLNVKGPLSEFLYKQIYKIMWVRDGEYRFGKPLAESLKNIASEVGHEPHFPLKGTEFFFKHMFKGMYDAYASGMTGSPQNVLLCMDSRVPMAYIYYEGNEVTLHIGSFAELDAYIQRLDLYLRSNDHVSQVELIRCQHVLEKMGFSMQVEADLRTSKTPFDKAKKIIEEKTAAYVQSGVRLN